MQPLTIDSRPLKTFPCRADKTPACAHGFDDATDDPQALDRLWSDVWPCNRPALVVVRTGAANGFSLLDIDPRRGGHEWYRVPVTRTHQTQSGGQHLLFDYCPGLPNTVDDIAPGILCLL
jgi:hypothetical protein